MTDERTGRLFKLYDNVEIISTTGERIFAYKLSENNYESKSAIMHAFVDDLYKAMASFLKEKKANAAATANLAKGGKGAAIAQISVEDSRVFSCTKDQLSQAVSFS